MTNGPEIMTRLRKGKRELRRQRAAMSLPEKIQEVVKLQKVHVTIVGRRRALKPLERVWSLRDR